MEGNGYFTHGAIWGDEDDRKYFAPHTPYAVGSKQGVGSVDQPEGEKTHKCVFSARSGMCECKARINVGVLLRQMLFL